MSEGTRAEPVARYLERETLTQSLAYAAILQARGFACPLAGAAIVLLQPRDGELVARMQRPRRLDLGLISRILERVSPGRVLLEPAPAGVAIDEDSSRTAWDYTPAAEDRFTRLFEARGYRCLPGKSYGHTKTSIVDLNGGMDAVESRMSSVARRNARQRSRDGVEYEVTRFCDVPPGLLESLHDIYDAFRESRPWLPEEWSFRRQMVEHFGTSGHLVTAHEEGRPVGAVYMPIHDRVAHYYAAFSSDDAASTKIGTGLVYEALRAAVDDGCDLFDFVGLWDERYPDRYPRWRGFSTFKSRFGGHDLYMPPSLAPAS